MVQAPRIKPEPGSASRSRPRAVVLDGDDSDSAEQDRQIKRKKTGNANGKGKGKAVVRDDDDDDDGNMDEQDDDNEEANRGTAPSGEKQQLLRDDTGSTQPVHVNSYVTGSIVRIACQSFLTYDNVEFRPGPALNMIIGPNGTGKSTIACAIAIGLGFPAKVLGRSPKLASYCKNNSTEDTWIEIELKGKPGKKNKTIKRYLSRETEKTRFEIDGWMLMLGICAPDHDRRRGDRQASRGGDGGPTSPDRQPVLPILTHRLHSTFLPQDRVASFAMMSPSELLRETEKAAGDVNLSHWHKVLIDEYKTCKDAQGVRLAAPSSPSYLLTSSFRLTQNVDRLAESLKRKELKQSEAEKEVKQFQQRRQYERDLLVVDVLAKFAAYNATYIKLQASKADRNRLENEVKELEVRNKPFRDSKAALRLIVDSCSKEQDALEKKVRRALKDAEEKAKQVQKAEEAAEECSERLRALKKEEELRKKEIKDKEREIAKLRGVVEKEPEEADTTAVQEQIADKTRERNEIVANIQEYKGEVEEADREMNNLRRDAEGHTKLIQQLNEATRIREAATRRFEEPTWRAVEWLRANKDKMKGQVFEPARLNVFPRNEFKGKKLNYRSDSDLLNMVEGPISLSAFKTFLFEYREDYDFMMAELADKQKLRIDGSECTVQGGLTDVQRPLTDDQLDKLGFDAFAIDLLQGPEPVLRWLCDHHNLHRIPIQIHKRALDTRQIESLRSITRYYTRDGSNSVKYSMYGNKWAQTEQRTLQSAKILSSGVDEERVKAVQAKMDEARQAYAELKGKKEKLLKAAEELKEQADALLAEKDGLVAEKEKLGKARSSWLRAKAKLETAERALEREKKKPSEEQKRAEIAKEKKKLTDKRVKLALQYKDFVLQATEIQTAGVKIHLQALQADSDHRAMESVVRERDEELETKMGEWEATKIVYSSLVKDGKKLQKEAEEAIDQADDNIKAKVMERRQEEELDYGALCDERDQISANLDCMLAISPSVLEGYKKRKTEITDLQSNLEDARLKLDESNLIISETKAQWLPKLQQLVNDVSKRFTASFDALGLLGEVRLAQDDDYEKWGIEIMVSFRDRQDDSTDVTLHVLSGHRQSGGVRPCSSVSRQPSLTTSKQTQERALTTVTYLLALADLARAPFALVDEINQGMDQRAERNMHKMLVETTCKDDVGQYFLLTPKLLPDLVYHPRMKVLVINSGSFIPSDLSLADMVATRRRLNQSRAVAAAH
ncbi:SPOSA6832_00604 [Sporobolomyces salmonicolor]|uniref:Structural maintenance of chromosomes protein 5 n=1 Tax=Sporidiobolus salmonicolor TaxID=5005 RepID=A0A0D6EGG3_SPOSA|nr:SPOSA6832_00604 [Sporobolomyces salmonicolor]